MQVHESLLNMQEVSDMLGISYTTLCRFIDHGLLVPDVVQYRLKNIKRWFKYSTIAAFINSYAVGDFRYNGETLYYSGEVARATGLSYSCVNTAISSGIISPDVILPAVNGAGRKVFTQKTIDKLRSWMTEQWSSTGVVGSVQR